MRSKGFTLIELLAVIVILAIIALIATPIILGIIKDSKFENNKRKVENYFRALELAITEKNSDGEFSPSECSIMGEQAYCKENSYKDNSLKKYLLEVEVTGDVPKKGIVKIKDGLVIDGSTLNIGGSSFIKENDEIVLNEKETVKNSNGEIVYFNVATGEKCEEKDYRIDNSATGYNGMNPEENQTSCLKFYKFLDYGDKNTVNLILDHNTTKTTSWPTSGSWETANGPTGLIAKLKEDTNGWKGTETPNNYEFKKSVENIYYTNYTINYTINYNTEKYKARIITAQEIAQITEADKYIFWDEEDHSSSTYYLDGSLGTDVKWEKEPSISSGESKYYWLYGNEPYCTSSTNDLLAAWHVSGNTINTCSYYTNWCGVRPVIEVLKSKLN